MFLVAPISTRNQFSRLLKERGLTGRAVEIGTHRGEFAWILLSDWPGFLTCVDPWTVPEGYEEQAKSLWGGQTREQDLEACQRLLCPHLDRVKLMRCTSADAVKLFSDGSLDFVYLDGDHRREHAALDLRRWWPKLRNGGLLAGHDIVCPGPEDNPHNWGPQIAPEVISFSLTQGVPIHLVVEENGLPWSFYLIKP